MPKPVPASPGHEEAFRANFELRPELRNDPYWRAVYEHAATYKLMPSEVDVVGAAIQRKEKSGEPLRQPNRGT